MNSKKNQKLPLGLLIAVVILVGVLAPQGFAQAACLSLTSFNLIDCLTGLAEAPLLAVGAIIGWSADLLAKFLSPQVQGLIINFDPVKQSWVIIRNFVNMFFILILIVMAFGTIFNIQKYSWQKLLAPFLIAAVFINFSFAIAAYVIEIANGLAAVFLRTISAVDIGQSLAQGMSLQRIFAFEGGTIVALANLSALNSKIFLTLIFALILASIVMFAFIVSFLFALARIPILWFLLILSPLAVIAYAFPNARPFWEKWRKAFFAWTFFLPVYIFFLMFAVFFISQKGSQINRPLISGGASASVLSTLFNVNDFFFFSLTILFLVGGLAMAMKIGSLVDYGVGKTFGAIEGWGKRVTGYRALKTGVKQTVERIKDEGLPGKGRYIFGGERAERLKAAGVAGVLGERGALEKQRAEEINKIKGKYERITDINELRGQMGRGSRLEQLATREVLKERGALNVDELTETYRLYGGRGSLSALKFARGIDYGELSGRERDLLLTGIDDPEIKRKILKAKAEKGDFRSKPGQTQEELNELVNQLKNYALIFQTEGDRKEFLNKAKKYALEATVRAQHDLGLIKKAADEAFASYQEAMREEIRKMKLDDIIELSPDTLQKLISDKEVDASKIIKAKLTKESLASIPGKTGAGQLAQLDGLMKEKETEFEAKETERLGKQAEAQAKGMKPLVDSINELINTIKTKT